MEGHLLRQSAAAIAAARPDVPAGAASAGPAAPAAVTAGASRPQLSGLGGPSAAEAAAHPLRTLVSEGNAGGPAIGSRRPAEAAPPTISSKRPRFHDAKGIPAQVAEPLAFLAPSLIGRSMPLNDSLRAQYSELLACRIRAHAAIVVESITNYLRAQDAASEITAAVHELVAAPLLGGPASSRLFPELSAMMLQRINVSAETSALRLAEMALLADSCGTRRELDELAAALKSVKAPDAIARAALVNQARSAPTFQALMAHAALLAMRNQKHYRVELSGLFLDLQGARSITVLTRCAIWEYASQDALGALNLLTALSADGRIIPEVLKASGLAVIGTLEQTRRVLGAVFNHPLLSDDSRAVLALLVLQEAVSGVHTPRGDASELVACVMGHLTAGRTDPLGEIEAAVFLMLRAARSQPDRDTIVFDRSCFRLGIWTVEFCSRLPRPMRANLISAACLVVSAGAANGGLALEFTSAAVASLGRLLLAQASSVPSIPLAMPAVPTMAAQADVRPLAAVGQRAPIERAEP